MFGRPFYIVSTLCFWWANSRAIADGKVTNGLDSGKRETDSPNESIFCEINYLGEGSKILSYVRANESASVANGMRRYDFNILDKTTGVELTAYALQVEPTNHGKPSGSPAVPEFKQLKVKLPNGIYSEVDATNVHGSLNPEPSLTIYGSSVTTPNGKADVEAKCGNLQASAIFTPYSMAKGREEWELTCDVLVTVNGKERPFPVSKEVLSLAHGDTDNYDHWISGEDKDIAADISINIPNYGALDGESGIDSAQVQLFGDAGQYYNIYYHFPVTAEIANAVGPTFQAGGLSHKTKKGMLSRMKAICKRVPKPKAKPPAPDAKGK
jgi:hypothetical protein